MASPQRHRRWRLTVATIVAFASLAAIGAASSPAAAGDLVPINEGTLPQVGGTKWVPILD